MGPRVPTPPVTCGRGVARVSPVSSSGLRGTTTTSTDTRRPTPGRRDPRVSLVRATGVGGCRTGVLSLLVLGGPEFGSWVLFGSSKKDPFWFNCHTGEPVQNRIHFLWWKGSGRTSGVVLGSRWGAGRVGRTVSFLDQGSENWRPEGRSATGLGRVYPRDTTGVIGKESILP